MTLFVKDASGATQTIKTNDDMAGIAGTPNPNVLTVQGAAGGAVLPVTVVNLPATQPISGAVTVSNLPATQAVSGTVGITNFPASQAVSVANLPLPSGAATDASLGTLGTTPPTLPGASTGIMGLLRWLGSLSASLIATAAGSASRVVLVDPVSGNGSLVQAFHNADNQVVGATSYGLLTGGVDQLINASGNLDRKRAVTGDGMSLVGLAAEAPMLWNGTTFDRAVNASGTSAKAQRVVVATDQPALPVYRPGSSYTDRSGTLTAGGTAQVLAAANPARRGYRVANLSSADLWINDKGGAASATQPAFKVAAGALYESPAFGAPTSAISIFGATTGQAFEAVEA